MPRKVVSDIHSLLYNLNADCSALGIDPPKLTFTKRTADRFKCEAHSAWFPWVSTSHPLNGMVYGIAVEEAPEPPLRLWARRTAKTYLEPSYSRYLSDDGELKFAPERPGPEWVEIPLAPSEPAK